MSAMLTTTVMIPTTKEYRSVAKNSGSANVFVYAAKSGRARSENSSVA